MGEKNQVRKRAIVDETIHDEKMSPKGLGGKSLRKCNATDRFRDFFHGRLYSER